MKGGGRGVVLALQNEFTEIFYIIFLQVFAGNEFYPNIPSNVELCQIQGLIGLKETTKQNTN